MQRVAMHLVATVLRRLTRVARIEQLRIFGRLRVLSVMFVGRIAHVCCRPCGLHGGTMDQVYDAKCYIGYGGGVFDRSALEGLVSAKQLCEVRINRH